MRRVLTIALLLGVFALPFVAAAHADIGPCNGCSHSAQISASRVG